ncbi:GNAT family N-acetyltransferase [Janibacter indicus]|uniref:GNAT family N-acetyltransferase n=1 Tax=Janibacter indicus TaxID=857417 RepID=UPI003EBBBC75
MSEVEIRPTIPADLDSLADVLVDVHAADGYPVEGVEDPSAWLRLSAPIGQWTALHESRPVGHVALVRPDAGDAGPRLLSKQEEFPLEEIAVLARLFVAPDHRGRSVAERLVRVAEACARAEGLRVSLEVMMKDVAAIRLYKKLGWKSIGEFEYAHGSNERTRALIMAANP